MNLNTVKPGSNLADADISEEIKQELALYRELKPLVARSLTINHELNNPLAGILGYLELIQEDTHNFSEDQKESFEQITYCAERLKECVKRLSDIKMKISEKVDLEAVMKELFPDEY